MTNKQAIKLLSRMKANLEPSISLSDGCRDVYNALDCAISALQRDGWLDYSDPAKSVYSCPVCGAVWKTEGQELAGDEYEVQRGE